MNQRLLAIVCATILVPGALAAPRLAILADNRLAPLADLLTARLSSETGIELVERTQISRILQEQQIQLAGMARSDTLRVGKLLNADGVISLDMTRLNGDTLVATRFVAVSTGVILDIAYAEYADAGIQAWGEETAVRTLQLMPKLGLPAREAIRLSVLNLRATTDSRESREAERSLTSLLIHRLVHEPRVFVLEREQMMPLAEEKSLAEQPSDFWSGSHLVDGSIESLEGTKGRLKVVLRLRPEGGAAPVQFEREGGVQNLRELAEGLVGDVLRALDQRPGNTPWDAAAEASQFLQEARWASAFNLHAKVRAAAEASAALGLTSPELTRLRLYSWRDELATGNYSNENVKQGLFGNLGLFGQLGYSTGPGGMIADPGPLRGPMSPRQGTFPNFGAPIPGTSGFPPSPAGGPESGGKNYKPPEPDGMIQALELYLDKLDGELVEERRMVSQIEWHWMGAELLTVASYLLYELEEYENPGDSAQKRQLLRQRIREAAAAMIRHDGEGVPEVYCLKTFYGPLWYDNPRDLFDSYREVIRGPGETPMARRRLIIHWDGLRAWLVEGILSAREGSLPFGSDRKSEWLRKMAPHWPAFAATLQSGTNVEEQATGLVLAHQLASTPQEKDAICLQMMEFIRKHQEEIVSKKMSSLALQLLPRPMTQEIARQRRDFGRDVFLYFCQNNSIAVSSPWNPLFQPVDYTREEAAALYAAVEIMEAKASPEYSLQWVKWKLAKQVMATLMGKYPDLGATSKPSPPKRVILGNPPLPTVTLPITVERLVRLQFAPGVTTALPPARQDFHRNLTESGGMLWSVFLTNSAEGKQCLLWRAPIADLKPSVIPVPSDSPWKDACLSLSGDSVWVFGDGRAHRYDTGSGRWSLAPGNLPPQARPTVAGQYLVFANQGVVSQVNLADGKEELLVSSRRNPPASPLDDPRYGTYELLPGREGEIYVKATERISSESGQAGFRFTGRTAYQAWNLKTRLWRPIRPIEACTLDQPPTLWRMPGRTDLSTPARLILHDSSEIEADRVALLSFQLSEADRAALESVAGEGSAAREKMEPLGMPTITEISLGLLIHVQLGSERCAWLVPRERLEALMHSAPPATQETENAAPGTGSATTASGGTSGRIVFPTNREGNTRIFSMNPDGTEQRRIQAIPAGSESPSLSPDGRKIAFTSGVHRNRDVYVANIDGSDLRTITDSWADDTSPDWAPDGRSLVFSSAEGDDRHIHVINVDGSGLRQLTSGPGVRESPSWSPDGQHIVFVHNRGTHASLVVCDKDGGNMRNLTDAGATDITPDWSPDGHWILFTSSRCGYVTGNPFRDMELYLVNPDGTDLKRLTHGHFADREATWSPDGRWIVCRSIYRHLPEEERFAFGEIYALEFDPANARLVDDGKTAIQLTDSMRDNHSPAWGRVPPPRVEASQKP